MAYPGLVALDRHHRPRSYAPGSSSAASAHDWRPHDDRLLDSLPHRVRSLAGPGGIQLEPVRRSVAASAAAASSAAAPRHAQSSWSETSPSAYAAVTMPVVTRSSVVSYRRGGGERERERDHYAHDHPDEYPAYAAPQPGARRSLRRRQGSPPSARSSRTSLCESAGVSDITIDTQDERLKLHMRHERPKREDHDRRHVGPEMLHHMRHVSPDRRVQRRMPSMRHLDNESSSSSSSQSSDEEDDMPPAPLTRRWTDDHHSPSPYHSRHYSRHSSRHRSEVLDSGSSVRRGPPRRSQSAIEEPHETRTPMSRPSPKHRSTRVVYADARPPRVRRSSTTPDPHVVVSRSPSSTRQRRSSLLGSFLSPAAQAKAPEKPSKQVQCVICLDDFASHKLPKFKCGHRMCSTCLKTVFKRSVKEPQEMPPKCCSQDIPLKFVDQLFNTSFKKTWNKKLVEFSTRNRVYCPYKRCGEWIRPENMYRTEDGRKCAKCGACKMKVCCSCNNKWHSSKKCPRDEEASRILEQAKEAGWQRCYKCKEMVELKEGCNHMTCRCGGQFCMICGSKWKSCECPWFNYEATDDDHLEMQVPSRLERAGLERLEAQHASTKMATRGTYESGVVPNAVRQRAMSYDEEEMVMKRLQERQDGDASRRRREQQTDHRHGHHRHHHRHHPEVEVEEAEEEEPGYPGRMGEMGNATGHFMNDDHNRRGPQHIVVPPSPPPAAGPMAPVPPAFDSAPPGGAGGDYLADVGRARGSFRQDSAERRLAERFSESRMAARDRAPHEMGGNPMIGTPTAVLSPPPGPPPPQGLGLHMAGAPLAPLAPMQRMGPPMMAPMMGDMGHALPPPRLMRASMSDPSGMVSGRELGWEEARRGVRRVATRERPRSSVMAGLSGAGRGMGRVHEWRHHVEPGFPDDGARG